MKQILLQIDDDIAAELERVAPAKSRLRSAFIRDALRRALWAREERATREAYRRTPDRDVAYFDRAVWEPARRRRRASTSQ